MRFIWLLCLLSALGNAALLAADPPVGTLDSQGGEPIAVERLELQALSGERVPFADLLGADGRAVCFAFLHPTCPLAQDYAPVLGQLAEEFADEGIRFVGVVCEVDAPEEIEAYRSDFKIPFPIDLDSDFRLAEALAVSVTPEVVLVDGERRVRYAGRIDDRYKIRGVMSPGTPDPELREAIVDLITGHTIREPRTEAVGCPIDRPERPVPDPSSSESHAVTYYHDVQPFLHGHCQQCHSPGQAGPFSLLSYDDAVDWIDVGLEEIEARRMPPAQIESDFDFSGPKAATAAEIAMLQAWVAAGKPEGNAADTPNLDPLPDYAAFEEDLGPPDIILEQPEPTQLGAHGNDVYRNIIFPLARPEDLRLRAIQVLPGNRKIVHHALVGHLPRETVEEDTSIRRPCR